MGMRQKVLMYIYILKWKNFGHIYILETMKSALHTYRICPIKRALRGGNERVCVYLLTKNGKWSVTLKNASSLTVDKQDPRSCPIHSS